MFAGYDDVRNNVANFTHDNLVDFFNSLVFTGWTGIVIRCYGALIDVLEATIPNKRFFNGIIDYCVATLGYDINIHKVDDQTINVTDLQESLMNSDDV